MRDVHDMTGYERWITQQHRHEPMLSQPHVSLIQCTDSIHDIMKIELRDLGRCQRCPVVLYDT